MGAGAGTLAGKDQFGVGRERFAVGVTIMIKAFKVFCGFTIVLYDVTGHITAGFLGEETNDLILPVLKIFEYDIDNRNFKRFLVYRFKVFIAGKEMMSEDLKIRILSLMEAEFK